MDTEQGWISDESNSASGEGLCHSLETIDNPIYTMTRNITATPKGRLIPTIRASGRRTSASGCTGWPTPNAIEIEGPADNPSQLAGWPTPNAGATERHGHEVAGTSEGSEGKAQQRQRVWDESRDGCATDRMGNADQPGPQGRGGELGQCAGQQTAGAGGVADGAGRMANTGYTMRAGQAISGEIWRNWNVGLPVDGSRIRLSTQANRDAFWRKRRMARLR